MIPWQELSRAQAPGGGVLSLHRRGEDWVIRISGNELMSSRRHASEQRLAELGCAGIARSDSPRLLIGGLGMGFTLRAALDLLPASAQVLVAELSSAVVAWNREYLGPLCGMPLSDARVTVEVADVADVIRQTRTRYHVILLDIDNGPQGLTRKANHALYATTGLESMFRALRPGGVMALWSAARHRDFENRMAKVGFELEIHTARAGGTRRGTKHTIYLGRTRTRFLR